MILLLILILWLISLSLRITSSGINSIHKINNKVIDKNIEKEKSKDTIKKVSKIANKVSNTAFNTVRMVIDFFRYLLTLLLPMVLVLDVLVFLLISASAGSYLLLFQDESSISGSSISISSNNSGDSDTNDDLKTNFQAINQNPELPTGCEVTSLTMVLTYLGVSADKLDIADNYIDKGPVGSTNFYEKFVGDPRDESSYGCYAPVIKKTANKYLSDKGSTLVASDISGKELEDLFSYIDSNTPVIVWGTVDNEEGSYTTTWNINGTTLRWYSPEHCMVLVGYEDDKIWVADPMHGDVRSYDRSTFKSRYNSLGKQAVVIQ